MINNERQYRITRAEADRFREALAKLDSDSGKRRDVHPRLLQAEREAMESQLQDLLDEMSEYEFLRSGAAPVIEIASFEDLPDGLIKARIALGLSQKALAERLELKEQQIQRYESERYASASLQRMQQIARALGVGIRKEILLPFPATTFLTFTAKLKQVGLDEAFVREKLLPSQELAKIDGSVSGDEASVVAKAAAIASRVFGWPVDALLGSAPLSLPTEAAAAARFKVPARRTQRNTSLYAAYANYLATVVADACKELPTRPVPATAAAFREAVLGAYSEITLRTVLYYAWDLGVPVVPLRDHGTFHGACWRISGRNIVVLKQDTRQLARWLFDLIHELFHAGQDPEASELEFIEGDENSPERRQSNEEAEASQFAGDVLLNGSADPLAQEAVEQARGAVQRLKSVLPDVAARHQVDVGAFANYMAHRLSWQGINWWGAAANLQDDDNPWAVARDVFFERFPYAVKDETDQQLLERALH